MREVSPVSSPTDVDDPVPPHVPPPTDDVADPVSPSEGEAIADAEPEAFGGGLVDLSLLPMYPDHTVRHIWDREERDPQKFLNHRKNIVAFPQTNEE
ncbi:unnamed protein product [Lathyrus oleraceus]